MFFHFRNGNLILCMQMVIGVQVIRIKTILLAPIHLLNTSHHSCRIENVRLADAGRTYFLTKNKNTGGSNRRSIPKYIKLQC